MKEVTCPCGAKITSETEEEVMEKGVVHGMNAHGMSEEEARKRGEGLRPLVKDAEA